MPATLPVGKDKEAGPMIDFPRRPLRAVALGAPER